MGDIRQRSGLYDVVGTAGCGVKSPLGLPAGPDTVEEGVRHVRVEASEVPQELGRLAVSHLL
jgi:predicted small lipoprotein YifL